MRASAKSRKMSGAPIRRLGEGFACLRQEPQLAKARSCRKKSRGRREEGKKAKCMAGEQTATIFFSSRLRPFQEDAWFVRCVSDERLRGSRWKLFGCLAEGSSTMGLVSPCILTNAYPATGPLAAASGIQPPEAATAHMYVKHLQTAVLDVKSATCWGSTGAVPLHLLDGGHVGPCSSCTVGKQSLEMQSNAPFPSNRV